MGSTPPSGMLVPHHGHIPFTPPRGLVKLRCGGSPVLILAGAVSVPVVLWEKREVMLLNLMLQPKPGIYLLCLTPRDISQPLWCGSIPHNFGQLPGVTKLKM